MEEIDKCFVAIDELQNRIQDSVIKTESDTKPDSPDVPSLSQELETNNNLLTEKSPPFTHLQLLKPEHIENGFLENFLKKHFLKLSSLDQILSEMQANLKELKHLHSIIASYAPSADFDQNPSNGYRAMMKINDILCSSTRQLLMLLAKKKKLKVKKLSQLLYIIRLTVLVNLIQLSWRAESDRLGHNSDEPNLMHQDTAIFWMDIYQVVVPYLGPYYIDHLGFFLPDKLRKTLNIMLRTVTIFHRLPNSLILPLSKKRMQKTACKAVGNPNMNWPLGAFASLDDIPFRKFVVNLYHIKTPVKCKTYFIPKQRQWTLRSLEDVLKDSEQPGFVYKNTGGSGDIAWDHRKVIKSNKFGIKPNTVRIRVMQNSKSKPDGTVLFHCHGGSFIFNSPDSHEIYMRDWIQDNPGMTIVSVDYQLRQIYPIPFQDVLDVFLWLTSGSDQVQQVLGFQPTTVVAAGDSVGAFLAYTLCLILTDIKEYATEKQLCETIPPPPKALVSIYGFFNLRNPGIFMSNSFLEVFLPATVIRIAFGALIKGCDEPSWNMQMFCHCFLRNKRPWYDTRYNHRENSEEILKTCGRVPYLTSLTSYDFNKIKIPHFLITSEFDVCQDHSIALCRKWKGKGSLDVIEGLQHGFLQLNFVNDLANKGNQLVSRRIKEAFSS